MLLPPLTTNIVVLAKTVSDTVEGPAAVVAVHGLLAIGQGSRCRNDIGTVFLCEYPQARNFPKYAQIIV